MQSIYHLYTCNDTKPGETLAMFPFKANNSSTTTTKQGQTQHNNNDVSVVVVVLLCVEGNGRSSSGLQPMSAAKP